MLAIGTIFLYGDNGVCRVEDIRKETFQGQEREYYILKPVCDDASTIHIPVDSTHLQARMRKLLTPDEVRALADTAPEAEPYWIANDIQRGEHFRKVLSECDRCELIRLLKSLHTRRQELSGCGRHLRTADQNIMKRAEKIVREEVSLVMHIDPDDVMPYLFEGRSASSLPTAH